MMQTTLSDRCRLADEIASKVRAGDNFLPFFHSLNLSDFDGRSVALLALVALEGDKAFPSDLTAPVAWVDE
jgi:hypothetical protein